MLIGWCVVWGGSVKKRTGHSGFGLSQLKQLNKDVWYFGELFVCLFWRKQTLEETSKAKG